VYRILVRKTDIKRPLGITKRRCEDNIKTHLKEIISYGVDLIFFSAYGQVNGFCECGNEPSGFT
jgi:hypothetical protein